MMFEPQVQVAPRKLSVAIIPATEDPIHFVVLGSMPFAKVFSVFEARVIKKPKQSFRFLWDGRRLGSDETPDAVGMEDGDQIHAMIAQMGS